MRNSFVQQMLIEMERNPSIFLLTGDVGFNALEQIEQRFPDRFINVGIAEATLVGLAAGLALTGKKAVCYAIASFMSMRPYEQIRDDVCYHNLDVTLVGVGGGFNYGYQGVTHHTIEDIAILSALPNMVVVNPAYDWEAKEATKALMRSKGPAYLRLGKNTDYPWQRSTNQFLLGSGIVMREGRDIVLISTGNMLDTALMSAEKVEIETGLSVRVISMPTVKPLGVESIMESLSRGARGIFTLEEHGKFGGMGSSIATTLAEQSLIPDLFRMYTLPDRFVKSVGSREFLLAEVGLDAESLAKDMITYIQKKI